MSFLTYSPLVVLVVNTEEVDSRYKLLSSALHVIAILTEFRDERSGHLSAPRSCGEDSDQFS